MNEATRSPDLNIRRLIVCFVGKDLYNILVCRHTTAEHTNYSLILFGKEVFMSKEASNHFHVTEFKSRIELVH